MNVRMRLQSMSEEPLKILLRWWMKRQKNLAARIRISQIRTVCMMKTIIPAAMIWHWSQGRHIRMKHSVLSWERHVIRSRRQINTPSRQICRIITRCFIRSRRTSMCMMAVQVERQVIRMPQTVRWWLMRSGKEWHWSVWLWIHSRQISGLTAEICLITVLIISSFLILQKMRQIIHLQNKKV